MVTGEEVDSKQITAGHIYRQGWPTGLLVSILTLTAPKSYTVCNTNISITYGQASLTCASAEATSSKTVSVSSAGQLLMNSVVAGLAAKFGPVTMGMMLRSHQPFE